jgi:hypothetical protein
MILGDDDWVSPRYVEEFFNALSQYPDIDAYFTDIQWFSDDGPVASENYTYPFGYMTGLRMLEAAAEHGLGIPTTSLVLRRSLFNRDSFLESPHGSSDWLFAYTALAKTTLYGNKEKLAGYRKSALSDTAKSSVQFMTGVSAVYIYSQIAYHLKGQGSLLYSQMAKQRAIECAINLGIRWKQAYRRYLRKRPQDMYQRHIIEHILPSSFSAKLIADERLPVRLVCFLARIRRKIRSIKASLFL